MITTIVKKLYSNNLINIIINNSVGKINYGIKKGENYGTKKLYQCIQQSCWT